MGEVRDFHIDLLVNSPSNFRFLPKFSVFTENDIMLVAAQANVDKEEANAALIDSEGDIAKAILFLKNKP